MRPALRSSAIASIVATAASLVAITPMATPRPDIQVRSSDVRLVSVADMAASTLAGTIDVGLEHLENFVLDGGVALDFIAYGLLAELSVELDNLGDTALGADVLTLANDASNTQWTAGVTDDFNALIALVNEIFPAASSTAAAVAADATATTLGGLIDFGLQELETLVQDSGAALGYAAYGLLAELSAGLDNLGDTALGADVLTLADDANSTQWIVGLTDGINELTALVNDLGLNSVPLAAGDAASSLAVDVAPSLTDIFSALF